MMLPTRVGNLDLSPSIIPLAIKSLLFLQSLGIVLRKALIWSSFDIRVALQLVAHHQSHKSVRETWSSACPNSNSSTPLLDNIMPKVTLEVDHVDSNELTLASKICLPTALQCLTLSWKCWRHVMPPDPPK